MLINKLKNRTKCGHPFLKSEMITKKTSKLIIKEVNNTTNLFTYAYSMPVSSLHSQVLIQLNLQFEQLD